MIRRDAGSTTDRGRSRTDGETDREPDRADLSAHLSLLSDRRRRRILRRLLEADAPLEVRSLAVALADGTDPEPNVDPSADESIRRLHVSLCHVHLPALEDYGYVEYDRADGVVRGSKGLERLDARLEGSADPDAEAPLAVERWARAIRS